MSKTAEKAIGPDSTAEEIQEVLQHALLTREDYNLILCSEMVKVAAEVGWGGKGIGGFCGYIEDNVGEMSDETLQELFDKFPEGKARTDVWDEIRWRAKERANKMN